MTTTIAGVFDTETDAQRAVDRLLQGGIDRSAVRLEPDRSDSSTSRTSDSAADAPREDRRGFFAKLFGWDDDDDDESFGHYDEATRRGHVVLSVQVDDESQVDRVSDLLEECGAIDVDERVAMWKSSGYEPRSMSPGSPPDATSTSAVDSDQGTLRAVEEQLHVGKRTVQRGRVRIHRSVSERPIEEQVTLHEERIRVDRTPVDRPATESDLARAFEGEDIELTETAEEAVVSKAARVVEEVRVGTEASDRVETVRDTVRSTRIDVEDVEDASARMSTASMTDAAGSSGSSGGYTGSERRMRRNTPWTGVERRMSPAM